MRLDLKKKEERFFIVLMIISALLIMSFLGFILGTILYKGLPALNLDMITKLPGGGFYLGKEGGVLNAIAGSLMITVGSVIISAVFSVPLVMYINFYLRKGSFFSNAIRFSFDILFGVPSIVYGAFGFALMVYLGLKASLLGGIISVSLLIMPVMMRSFDEVAKLLPHNLPEALLSLGSTKYEMIKVLLRQLMPALITAVLLSVGRGIGDAATVLFTSGYTDNIPTALGQPAATLPLSIFFQLGSPVEEVQNRAYASAVILTVIILVLSFISRYFSAKYSKNKI
ncbi:MAG: ABC transporter permease subunit [Bacteroidales bacterium]|jgi:phosphate transport system permease protein|nr:ABC transporter permease subunit [Bacteroidales bacterium]